MSHNLEYLLTRPGGLKIATVIFGLVAAILNGHSYANSPYTDFYEEVIRPKNNTWNIPGTELELSNMTNTFIFFGLSIVYLAAHSLFYALCESRLNKFIDVTFHLCGALFLFAGGITLIYSAVHIEENGCIHFQFVSAGPTPKHHFSTLPSFLASSLSNIFASSSPSTAAATAATIDKTVASGVTGTTSRDANKICHYFGEKIVGGSLNILNGVVYGFLALVIFGTQVEDM